jgi:glycosyltransferase involved in cell wall biosynthesis
LQSKQLLQDKRSIQRLFDDFVKKLWVAVMSNNPFFTIITASFNNQSTITQTLESIKNQTFQNFEHIVIDGGSNDGTVEILKELENSYNISWLSEPDQGIAEALNKGLRQAQGKYIIVIQADDSLLTPNILEKVYPLLKMQRIDILSFPVILQHPDKGKVLRKPNRLLWWNHFKFIFPHQGCFVHQRVFKKIGGFRKEFKINMDYDFFYRALQERFMVKFGKFPVAIMGGKGVGTNLEMIDKRLKEERLVQRLNERNPLWRLAQNIFACFYLPYKMFSIKRPLIY